jgi:hypothetical protein
MRLKGKGEEGEGESHGHAVWGGGEGGTLG